MNTALLSPEEQNLLQNSGFYQAKQRLAEKIQSLLGECSQHLLPVIEEYKACIPDYVRAVPPKISRGENYLGYPWMMLDHPRYFKGDDVFALRTLCWWANGFSHTIHLSGFSLVNSLPGLSRSAALLAENGYYISINSDQWLHHFDTGNYVLLSDYQDPSKQIHQLAERGFLKIMQRVSLDQYADLPDLTRQFATSIFQALQH